MQDYFAMIMLVDISTLNISFADFAEQMRVSGEELGVDIRAMHEDIFNAMHTI